MRILSLTLVFVHALTAGNEPAAGAKELFIAGRDGGVVTAGSQRRVPPQTDARVSKPATSAVKPAARRTASRPAFGLKYWIELIETPGQPGRSVTATRAFHSGEKVRLHFESNTSGEITIVQVGSSGASTILFPDPAKNLVSNTLRAGVDHVLPSPDHWFRFDTNPGTERLIVVFAHDRRGLDEALRSGPRTGPAATATLVRNARALAGSKDLVAERVESAGETYVVSKARTLVAFEIPLVHK